MLQCRARNGAAYATWWPTSRPGRAWWKGCGEKVTMERVRRRGEADCTYNDRRKMLFSAISSSSSHSPILDIAAGRAERSRALLGGTRNTDDAFQER